MTRAGPSAGPATTVFMNSSFRTPTGTSAASSFTLRHRIGIEILCRMCTGWTTVKKAEHTDYMLAPVVTHPVRDSRFDSAVTASSRLVWRQRV